jgi:hypothetical protein
VNSPTPRIPPYQVVTKVATKDGSASRRPITRYSAVSFFAIPKKRKATKTRNAK